jgi:hypothetical protein
MKRIYLKRLLVFGLGLILSGSAVAQQTTPPRQQETAEQRAERMTQLLKTDLSLTEEQTRQAAAINRRTSQEMDQIQNNRDLAQPERRDQIQQLQVKRENEIRALLTDQQLMLFEQHQENRRNQQPGRRNPAGKRRGGN